MAAGSRAGRPPAAAAAAPANPQHSLHDEIASFIATVTETAKEHTDKTTAVRKVQTAVRAAGLMTGAHVQVQTFGSFVNGLGMHSSDLDLVITGILAPDHPQNGGYADKTKVKVNRLLGQLRGTLLRAGHLASCEQVRRARVPILKCVLKGGQQVDVSISNGAGPAAATYLRDKAGEFPALRPLVLVLKCVLGQAGLNDASKGGLSSFALANMALASLQEDIKAGRGGADFGACLHGFLLRFGTSFKVYTEAVAVGRGGIVQKEQVPAMVEVLANPIRKDGTDALQRLCVEDPQTGREVAGGTNRVKQVLAAFRDAGAKLHQAQFLGQPGGCLRALFDVDAAVRRDPRAAAQALKQSTAKLPAAQAAAGKRKRQSDGATATPQPAAKRQAASSGPSGAAASVQRRQSGAAAGHGAGRPHVAAAAPSGSTQPGRMGEAARPVPGPTHGSGVCARRLAGRMGSRGSGAQGGRGGFGPQHAPRDEHVAWRQQQEQPAQSAPQWRPQQQHVPRPNMRAHQLRAWPQQPPQGRAFATAAMPTDPTGSQMPPYDQQGPFAEAPGPGHASSRGHMRPPPQQQHMGHWQPRPQGQHIRFPDDDWSPPQQQQQQQQQHFRHSSQMGPQQHTPWELPQQQQHHHHHHQPSFHQQQQQPIQNEHLRQGPPSWQRHHEPPDWQPPQHDAAPDWQPPVQLPHAGGWQGGAGHAAPGMQSPSWR